MFLLTLGGCCPHGDPFHTQGTHSDFERSGKHQQVNQCEAESPPVSSSITACCDSGGLRWQVGSLEFNLQLQQKYQISRSGGSSVIKSCAYFPLKDAGSLNLPKYLKSEMEFCLLSRSGLFLTTTPVLKFTLLRVFPPRLVRAARWLPSAQEGEH